MAHPGNARFQGWSEKSNNDNSENVAFGGFKTNYSPLVTVRLLAFTVFARLMVFKATTDTTLGTGEMGV